MGRKIEEQPNGCWLWAGYKDKKGYGKLRVDGKTWYAHRYYYTIYREPIPEGLTIDHLCRNTSCVNPNHLEVVTLQENIRRGESISVIHSRKTHCPKNHPYSDDNTQFHPDGSRRCKACASAREKQKRESRGKSDNFCRGETHHAARLTTEKVRDIKKKLAAGYPQKELADEHGVSVTAIHYIHIERNWKNIKP